MILSFGFLSVELEQNNAFWNTREKITSVTIRAVGFIYRMLLLQSP